MLTSPPRCSAVAAARNVSAVRSSAVRGRVAAAHEIAVHVRQRVVVQLQEGTHGRYIVRGGIDSVAIVAGFLAACRTNTCSIWSRTSPMGFNNPNMPWSEVERLLSGPQPPTWQGRPRARVRRRGTRAATGRHGAASGSRTSRRRARPRRHPAAHAARRVHVPYAELHCHSNFSFLDGASHPEQLVEEAHRSGAGGAGAHRSRRVLRHRPLRRGRPCRGPAHGVRHRDHAHARASTAAGRAPRPTPQQPGGHRHAARHPRARSARPAPGGARRRAGRLRPSGPGAQPRAPGRREGRAPVRSARPRRCGARSRLGAHRVPQGCGAGRVGGTKGRRRPARELRTADGAVRARPCAGGAVGSRPPARFGAQRCARRTGGPPRRGLRGHQQRALRHAGTAAAGHRQSPRCARAAQPRRARSVAAGGGGCPSAQRRRAGSAGSSATRAWSSSPPRSAGPRRSTCRWWRRACRRTRARRARRARRSPRCSTCASWSRPAAAVATASARQRTRTCRCGHGRGAPSTTSSRSSSTSGSPATSWWCGTSSSSATGRTSTARAGAARPTARSATRSVSPRPTRCRSGLLFERFLSTERDGPPDIDLDIESDRREEVIQYVYQRYGRHHTAQVANVITYRARSSVRDMAKALGYAAGQQDAWSKQMDAWGSGGHHRVADATRGAADHDIPAAVLELAAEIEDAPRHLGIHSGGMVICDRPVIEVCPVEWGRMDRAQRAAVGQGRLRRGGVGEVRPAGPGHAQRAALCRRSDQHAPRLRGRPGHHPAGGRRVRHALPGRHGGRVPDRVASPDGHAAAAEAAPLLRPGGGGRAHPPGPHPGRVGAPLHPSPQRAGAHHLPASAAGELAGQDPGCAAVPGTADADGHRRGRVHARPRPTSCARRWAPNAAGRGWNG